MHNIERYLIFYYISEFGVFRQFDGSTWLDTNTGEITTELYNTGNSGKATGGNDYSPTGYIVRKMMGLGNWNVGGRTLMLLRLANIYMDYIEALNETQPEDPDILKYLNLIRDRAGIPLYGTADLPLPANQDDMRDLKHAGHSCHIS